MAWMARDDSGAWSWSGLYARDPDKLARRRQVARAPPRRLSSLAQHLPEADRRAAALDPSRPIATTASVPAATRMRVSVSRARRDDVLGAQRKPAETELRRLEETVSPREEEQVRGIHDVHPG